MAKGARHFFTHGSSGEIHAAWSRGRETWSGVVRGTCAGRLRPCCLARRRQEASARRPVSGVPVVGKAVDSPGPPCHSHEPLAACPAQEPGSRALPAAAGLRRTSMAGRPGSEHQ